MSEGPIHAFLAGRGRDGRGRTLADVVAFDDRRIEGVHDFVQWCFPLAQESRAVPGSPVLGEAEAEAIRDDSDAQRGLGAATARMTRFYGDTDGWLTASDHNHLRITRIITALRLLSSPEAARAFHAYVTARNAGAGALVNPRSLAFWDHALAA